MTRLWGGATLNRYKEGQWSFNSDSVGSLPIQHTLRSYLTSETLWAHKMEATTLSIGMARTAFWFRRPMSSRRLCFLIPVVN